MSADVIHAMSEQLAADPASLVFLPLAEELLARGDVARAARVATRGAQRHAGRPDAHDLVARVALAQGDEAAADAAWSVAVRLDPYFFTAHRGLGFGWQKLARHILVMPAAGFTDWPMRTKFRPEHSRGAVFDNATGDIVTLLLRGGAGAATG